MNETFENAPASVAEHRAFKADDAKQWAPRDALVQLLRMIDRGELDATRLVIVLEFRNPDGSHGTLTRQAGTNRIEALGLLSIATWDTAQP